MDVEKIIEEVKEEAKNIVDLDLSFQDLEQVQETIGRLQNLKSLRLKGLEQVPESIGHLQNLKILFISSNHLEQVSEAIGQLKKLELLYIRGIS